jgi:hypothetical protein
MMLEAGGNRLTFLLQSPVLCLDITPINPPEQLISGEVLQVHAVITLKKYE